MSGANWNATGGARPRRPEPSVARVEHSFNGYVEAEESEAVLAEHGGSIKLLRATMSTDGWSENDPLFMGLDFGEIAHDADTKMLASVVTSLAHCLAAWLVDELKGLPAGHAAKSLMQEAERVQRLLEREFQ